jgi:3-phosphoshikimate 1-carboxyvinyltransferase
VPTSLTILPGGTLEGHIAIPGDKSITHRALILGALQKPNQKICLNNWLQSLDCYATRHALQAMDVHFEDISAASVMINSVGLYGLQQPSIILDVGNSGTCIRLLTGVLAGQRFSSIITGDVSICKRPMRRIITPLTAMGAKITAVNDEYAPLKITGGQKLRAIQYSMPVASAQVKSAILLASLYASTPSTVHSPSQCRDHTEVMIKSFSKNVDIPGDISAAAFFIVGASITIGSDITLENIGINPTRTGIIKILLRMGANIEISLPRQLNGEWRADVRVKGVTRLKGLVIPEHMIANAIDELPILCLAAACADGVTMIRGASELRHKESDRIVMMAAGLTKLGIQVEIFNDGLAVYGGEIRGGCVDSGGDHRIAMTFAMAGLVAQGPIMIQDTQNIATSFPSFVPVARQAGLLIVEENAYA